MSKLTLLVQEAAGALRPATSEEILSAARSILSRTVRRGVSLESPRAVRDYLSVTLGNRPYEIFGVIYVDNRHRLIEWQELFRGTLDGASVYPREVVKEALARNAAACILVHNHPSGVAEPSLDETCQNALSGDKRVPLAHPFVGCRSKDRWRQNPQVLE